ncbi:hypothetical protein [Clavibacter sp. CT19]|uniref:hypothetical protein n=1 Tax=unclassified Clavibacter TaxID=2626594 RepID=UPI0022EAB1D7|nr:hypothetical protein [Clavibacter sp. CT19]MDA3804455.1 hypothetical protein [Clavibacter sp. CT19]
MSIPEMGKYFLDSPVGRLQVAEADDGSRFAQGRHSGFEDAPFISIKLTEEGSLSTSVDFVRSRILGLERFALLASAHLADALGGGPPAKAKRLVWGEELTFWGGSDWSILFSEGLFDICEPYGVMVDFTSDEVVGFVDLSSAEEIRGHGAGSCARQSPSLRAHRDPEAPAGDGASAGRRPGDRRAPSTRRRSDALSATTTSDSTHRSRRKGPMSTLHAKTTDDEMLDQHGTHRCVPRDAVASGGIAKATTS